MVKHNKLVRDRIPDIISEHGSIPVTRTLDTEDYRQELKRKLREEVAEYEESDDVKELADVLEVVYALAATNGVDRSQIEEIRRQKREERGGFDDRIFLVETH